MDLCLNFFTSRRLTSSSYVSLRPEKVYFTKLFQETQKYGTLFSNCIELQVNIKDKINFSSTDFRHSWYLSNQKWKQKWKNLAATRPQRRKTKRKEDRSCIWYSFGEGNPCLGATAVQLPATGPTADRGGRKDAPSLMRSLPNPTTFPAS